MHSFEVALEIYGVFECFEYFISGVVFDDVDIASLMLDGDYCESIVGPEIAKYAPASREPPRPWLMMMRGDFFLVGCLG